MRKLLLLAGLLLSFVFCVKMTAQTAPEASTASNPKWYYIQVVGGSTTIGKVVTVVDDKLEGQSLASNISIMNKQLWRLELVSGIGYLIINKATGKRLSVGYDETKNQRIAIVSDDANTHWRYGLQANNTGFQLRLANETNLEGTPGDIYLYQTSLTQNYALVFTGSTNSTGVNATFNFFSNEIPIASTDDEEVWMYVKNVKTGKYLTDAVESSQDKTYFQLDDLKTDENILARQWKLVTKTNSRMAFVNRATGNIINSDAVLDRYYYLLYTNNPEDGDGWNFELISDNQYAVYTTDAKGIMKYWYATTPNQQTESYIKDYAKNSAYAWSFAWVPNVITSINNPSMNLPDDIRVYSYNKRIYVEGCNDYKIITIYGTPVYQNSDLPSGVYLVITKGKTTKVLIK